MLMIVPSFSDLLEYFQISVYLSIYLNKLYGLGTVLLIIMALYVRLVDVVQVLVI